MQRLWNAVRPQSEAFNLNEVMCSIPLYNFLFCKYSGASEAE